MARRDGFSRREGFSELYEISCMLNTGLDEETLDILLQLLDQGINPEVPCKIFFGNFRRTHLCILALGRARCKFEPRKEQLLGISSEWTSGKTGS